MELPYSKSGKPSKNSPGPRRTNRRGSRGIIYIVMYYIAIYIIPTFYIVIYCNLYISKYNVTQKYIVKETYEVIYVFNLKYFKIFLSLIINFGPVWGAVLVVNTAGRFTVVIMSRFQLSCMSFHIRGGLN